MGRNGLWQRYTRGEPEVCCWYSGRQGYDMDFSAKAFNALRINDFMLLSDFILKTKAEIDDICFDNRSTAEEIFVYTREWLFSNRDEIVALSDNNCMWDGEEIFQTDVKRATWFGYQRGGFANRLLQPQKMESPFMKNSAINSSHNISMSRTKMMYTLMIQLSQLLYLNTDSKQDNEELRERFLSWKYRQSRISTTMY